MSQKNLQPVPQATMVSQEDGQPFPITVSPVTDVAIKNGGTGGLAVSLPVKPSQNVTVKTSVIDGSGKLSVSAGGSLTFTPGNYSTPQGVTLQSVAAEAGFFKVLVAPFGVDLPGFTATTASILVS